MPSTGVDMVFNINSLTPYSRSSIIYDADFRTREIIIAQPLTPFSKNTDFKDLHLTTIIHDKTRKIRTGVACTHFKIIDKFTLASSSTVPAVRLKYEMPVIEINIRSAFRLPLSKKYIIKGKIIVDKQEYYSPADFSIRDISLTGIGLIVPKKKSDRPNPLTLLTPNQELIIGVIMVNMTKDTPSGTLPIKAVVKRINPKYSETHTLVGLKIIQLKPDKEELLNKFIHEAQIDELSRLSRRT